MMILSARVVLSLFICCLLYDEGNGEYSLFQNDRALAYLNAHATAEVHELMRQAYLGAREMKIVKDDLLLEQSLAIAEVDLINITYETLQNNLEITQTRLSVALQSCNAAIEDLKSLCEMCVVNECRDRFAADCGGIVWDIWRLSQTLHQFFTDTLPDFFKTDIRRFFENEVPPWLESVQETYRDIISEKIVEYLEKAEADFSELFRQRKFFDKIATSLQLLTDDIGDYFDDDAAILIENLDDFEEFFREDVREFFTEDFVEFFEHDVGNWTGDRMDEMSTLVTSTREHMSEITTEVRESMDEFREGVENRMKRVKQVVNVGRRVMKQTSRSLKTSIGSLFGRRRRRDTYSLDAHVLRGPEYAGDNYHQPTCQELEANSTNCMRFLPVCLPCHLHLDTACPDYTESLADYYETLEMKEETAVQLHNALANFTLIVENARSFMSDLTRKYSWIAHLSTLPVQKRLFKLMKVYWDPAAYVVSNPSLFRDVVVTVQVFDAEELATFTLDEPVDLYDATTTGAVIARSGIHWYKFNSIGLVEN